MVPIARETTTPTVEEDIFAQDEDGPSFPTWLLDTIPPATPEALSSSASRTKGPKETTPLSSQIVKGEVWRPVLPNLAPVLMTPPIDQRPVLPTPAHVLRTQPAQSRMNILQPACPLELPGLSVTFWSTATSKAPG